MTDYQLKKTVWTHRDFEEMGWHDVAIWSMTPNIEKHEYILDMDYIFKWEKPNEGDIYLRCWLAPATMVFENIHSVRIDIESCRGDINISELCRENAKPDSNQETSENIYRFECLEGEISLHTTGFTLYTRQAPRLLSQQKLDLKERGGVSFERPLNVE